MNVLALNTNMTGGKILSVKRTQMEKRMLEMRFRAILGHLVLKV